jgi:hypothetical protein
LVEYFNIVSVLEQETHIIEKFLLLACLPACYTASHLVKYAENL